MAVTLADHAATAANEGKLVLSEIALWALEQSPVLQILPWATNPELAVQITAWASLPTIGTRKVNASFSESTGKYEQKIEDKYIFGHYIDVDTVIATANPNARQNQRKASAKAMSFKFNDMFINGDPASDEFKGLSKRVDDANTAGYTDQYFNGGSATAGRGVIYDSTEQHHFLDMIAKTIEVTAEANPDALFMNSKLYLCVESATRRTSLLNQTKDMFGRIINMYGTVPIYKLGPISAFSTTLILPNSEVLNSGADETSIYACKFSEEEYLWGMQQKPMEVIDHGRISSASVYRDEVQWVIGIAVNNPRSVTRAYGFVADNGAS
uniref:Putative capsid protein n=1 Tax=viral metagenome TaxID=1070528 RepID=A0A6M3JY90_9ZZZZ